MALIASKSGYIETDGGRAAAGYRGQTGDCAVRAAAIATDLPYQEVYDALADGTKKAGRPFRSFKDGCLRKVLHEYLASLGWEWTPTMLVGTGCVVHLREDELPPGRVVARVSKHFVATIDGVIYDDHDPSRDGTRCVYGFWSG